MNVCVYMCLCVGVCGSNTHIEKFILSLPLASKSHRGKIRWKTTTAAAAAAAMSTTTIEKDENDDPVENRRGKQTHIVWCCCCCHTTYDCIGATKRVSNAFEENYYLSGDARAFATWLLCANPHTNRVLYVASDAMCVLLVWKNCLTRFELHL